MADFNKSRGGNRDDKARKTGSGRTSESIDASPGDVSLDRPRNVTETKAWKEGQAGARRIWWNYKQSLIDSFKKMPRAMQEQMISQISMIVTIGTTALLLSFFYNFLPQMIRVMGVPLMGIAAWWAGTRIVAPIMIGRYEEYLNRDF
jgi:hypothetical protein